MTSERYFCRESERISWMKATVLEDVMAVLRRLMKAVFFFKDESSELLVEKISTQVSVQETGILS